MERRNYGLGTAIITTRYPFAENIAAYALCSDGVIRRTVRLSPHADTFFSTGAAVRVRGKYVTGFLSVETLEGLSTPAPHDPAVVKFTAHNSKAHLIANKELRSIALVSWLAAFPHITCVRPIVATIRGKQYHGAAYHAAEDAGNGMRLYLLGELPACYRRSSRTAFVINGEDWYIACHCPATIKPEYAGYHPFGAWFMLCRWAVPRGDAIDRYEPRPYHRIATTLA